MLPCALFLLLAVPSHAGHWVYTLTGNYASPTANTTFVNSIPQGSTPSPLVFGPSNCQTGFSAQGTLTLNVTATLTWVNQPGEMSTPPATITVLENATVWALYSPPAYPPMVSIANKSADNGFQDAPVLAPAGYYGESSSGTHLTQMTIAAGQTTITLQKRTLTASISWSPANYLGGIGSSTGTFVNYGVTVDQDNRTVLIVGGRVTDKKVLISGVDAKGDGLWKQVPNQVDGNGNLSDDIAIAYGEVHDEVISGSLVPVDSTIKLNSTYLPGIFGNWATEGSQYLETSSAKHVNRQGSLGDESDPPPTAAAIPRITNTFVGPTIDDTNSFKPGVVTWNDAGTSDKVVFKYTNGDNRQMIPTPYPTGTDGDGVIASATYTLNIHHPLESFPSHEPSETVYRIATAYPVSGINPQTGQMDIPMAIDSPGYATYGQNGTNGASVNVHLNNPSVSWDNAVNTLAGIGTLPFPGEYAILDQIFTGASILVNYNKPDVETHTAAFNDGACWTDPWSTGQGTYPKSMYHMFPRYRVRYTRSYSLVDSYNMDGFQTESLTYYDKFLDNFSYFGYFQFIGGSK